MNEQSLDDFFNKLVRTLMQDLGFYIPSAIIPAKVLDKLQSSIPEHFLNEISILDIQNGFGVFEIEEFNKRLLLKSSSLEKNIFHLLRKRKELDKFEFNFILGKYFDQAEFYFFLTHWLATNLTLYNKKQLDISIIGAFEIQNEFYKSHFTALIKHFYPTNEIELRQSYDISELLKVYFPDLIARYDLANTELTIQSTMEIPKQEFINDKNTPEIGKLITIEEKPDSYQPSLKKETKKMPLVADKQAEDFLLTTVFNLKLY